MLVLGLICLLGFGNYFCYDTPASLEVPIEAAMSVDTSQFTSLYALYSWPNVVMCFFGGVLIDRVLGIRLGSIVFLLLLVVGQFLLALGPFVNQFWVMQLGRFIYGLGGESLSVAQNTYVVSWFKGRELNTVFGLQITVSRAGSALALNVMKKVLDSMSDYEPRTALGWTLLIAGLTCVISLVAAIILALLDKRAQRILERETIRSEENISLRDATRFKPEFWMLTTICVAFYLTIFPFISIGTKFFQTKWGYDQDKANTIDSIVYMISAVSSPVIGLFIDKIGRNLVFLLIASVLVNIAHFLMALTYVWLWFPMITLGIGYSIMCSALWPLVAMMVPESKLGTAYGVMQAFQNLGLAVTANVTGYLVDSQGYMFVELFFVFWTGVSVIFSILLIVIDHRTNGPLNKSAAERKRSEEAANM